MGGEEEQAVVPKVREFQVCGICYFRGVGLFRGFGFRGQDEFHVQSPTERPPTPDTGPGALSDILSPLRSRRFSSPST